MTWRAARLKLYVRTFRSRRNLDTLSLRFGTCRLFVQYLLAAAAATIPGSCAGGVRVALPKCVL